MKIKFLGAAQTVTGSRTLVEYGNRRYLVDCGLFQGPKEKRLLNWEPFVDASTLNGVILTHAHLDHSGYIPKLVKEGLHGVIYCSQGTLDLCKILLRDAGRLQEEDAKYANKTGYSNHKPALPLYDEIDAISSLNLFEPLPRDTWINLFDGMSVRLIRAGHIIGASFVQISYPGVNGPNIITFTGDIGNNRSLTIKSPANILETDYLVVESTYGDRPQPRTDPSIELGKIINRVSARGGVLVIPAFSVGRTQEILYLIKKLETANAIPKLPVYVDSPMALDATEIYMNHPEDHQVIIEKDGALSPFCCDLYQPVRSADDSMLLCMKEGPMIVISAAGMLTGGRILHHIKHRITDPKNAILFVGYQAEGTKGRLLLEGLADIRIHHQTYPVEAEILSMDNLSAHADADDIIEWIGKMKRLPKRVFVNHGEPPAAAALAERIRRTFNVDVRVPQMGEEFNLNKPDTIPVNTEERNHENTNNGRGGNSAVVGHGGVAGSGVAASRHR